MAYLDAYEVFGSLDLTSQVMVNGLTRSDFAQINAVDLLAAQIPLDAVPLISPLIGEITKGVRYCSAGIEITNDGSWDGPISIAGLVFFVKDDSDISVIGWSFFDSVV